MLFIAILLCLLGLEDSQTCIDSEDLIYNDPTPGELSWGVRIKEKFLEFHPVSLWTCSEQCMRRKGCLSFNFCENIDFYELNYVEMKNGTQNTDGGNHLFIHSDISSWEKSMQIIGNCSGRPCAEKYQCNAGGLCELSDCGKLPDIKQDHAVFIGYGDHRIGNGVLFGCEEPFPIVDQLGVLEFGGTIPVICDISGDWQISSFSCDDSNMRQYDNHWYYFSPMVKNWNDANIFCRERRSHLVKIEDETEFNWIQSQIKAWTWSGGNDIEHYNKWVWEADNSEVTLQWHGNEPNGAYEHCLLIVMNYKGGADYRCNKPWQFICEY